MGSTGGGSFSDYSGSGKGGTGTGGAGGAGGASGSDRCRQAFACTLEEVGLCDYYSKYKNVPPTGTPLNIVYRNRLFAVDMNGLTVGALPTSFNYLVVCLNNGISYNGTVTMSANSPIPSVNADFIAV